MNSLFTRLGEYLDGYLQLLVSCSIPYLKDSKELISLIKDIPNSDGCLLATIDVNPLYTDNVQKDRLEEVKWALNNKSNLKKAQIDFIFEGM